MVDSEIEKFWSLLRGHEEGYIEGNSLKVGVVGSEKMLNPDEVIDVFRTLSEKPKDICIVTGGVSMGVEYMAKELTSYHDMPYKEFTPQFKKRKEYTAQPDYMKFDRKYETYYYFKRNREMAEHIDLLLVFAPEGASKLTKHLLGEAKDRGKKTIVIQ